MNKNILNSILIFTVVLFTFACNTQSEDMGSASQFETISDVITAEAQDSLTPEQIIERLKEGNERFINNELTLRNFQEQVSNASGGQYPEAVIISCIDSRVPVEHVFDKGVGDIFVARVAGNFVNEDILGSTEFGTAVAGSKVVVVLGHESCGAVKSAIDDVRLGNITAMLSKIKPAVAMSDNFEGEKSTDNNNYVTQVVNNNVSHAITQMRERSTILADLESNGEIIIAGAFYDLDTGKVTFLD